VEPLTAFSQELSGQEGAPAASVFTFAGENGTIMGWSPTLNLGNAFLAYDDKSGGVIHKGLALAQNGQDNFLYATDFHIGKITFSAARRKLRRRHHRCVRSRDGRVPRTATRDKWPSVEIDDLWLAKSASME
jgi:hypothetical protein